MTNIGTRGLSILLVEDDRFLQTTIADHLTSRGMIVHQADNGHQALELIAGHRYDLVLADIIMPEMDGLEMLGHIRKRLPSLPVIMITSSRDVTHCINAMRLSVTDYILKPVDFDDLETRIALAFMKIEARRRDETHRFQLVEKVIEKDRKAEETFLQSIHSFINAIEARDRYTKGHSLRVTRLVDLLMKKMGVSSRMSSDIVLASQLHDAGKMGISDGILNKRSGLSSEEFTIMKTHPEVGYFILKPILSEEGLKGILHHHERWDGTGYPLNLSGEGIPLAARLINIADSYDAMISDRTYRHSMRPQQALSEIERCAGTQFDPDLVPAFISVVSQAAVGVMQ
ncbi:MAG: response regulator [bacterium]|nr:response regulator [bacterium]